MEYFGHNFELIGNSHSRDLLTLEREGVVYSDQWIDELEDFRHVRIDLTQAEIDEFVRSMWAYELFLRAGSPESASEVEGIPPDIAKRADSYELRTIDGRTEGPPYHCPASFYGPELESLLCLPGPRRVVVEELGSAALLTTIKRAVDSLTPAIRSFNKRERGLDEWPVSCEDDVRDLLFVMLRASLEDIKREEAVPSHAGTHKFVDLASTVAKLFIEIKLISTTGRWKKVIDEVRVDCQAYPQHPDCRTLVFVIVDAARDIPDPRQLERDFTFQQTIGERKVDMHLFVREP